VTVRRVTPPVVVSWIKRAFWAAFYLALLAGLFFAARSLPWQAAFVAMRQASPLWLIAAAAINFLGLPLWATQWYLLAPSNAHRTWRKMVEIVGLVGAAQNTYTSVGGAASAVLLLIRRAGLSRREALSLYALDQVLTGIGKVAIIGLALFLVPLPIWRGAEILFVSVAAAVAALACIVYAGTTLAHSGQQTSHWVSRLLHRAQREAVALVPLVIRACGRPLALVFARKLADVGTAVAVQLACGIPVSIEAAILITAAVDLANVIPSIPGSLGIFEAAVLFVYGFLGVPPAVALSAALLQHAAHLLPAIGFGYAVLLFRATRLDRTSSIARE
jgi:uncharacterized membrane protein YbhN (UPF0104 family)